MGIRQRRRMPTYYRPDHGYFVGGLMLCLTFAVGLAGIQDSYLVGDWIWFWFFVAAETSLVVLYFVNVWWMLSFTNRTGDDEAYYEVLQCGGERDTHDPDQREDPAGPARASHRDITSERLLRRRLRRSRRLPRS